MDFTQATLLSGAVFAVTTMFDKLLPKLQGWALQLAALVIGVGVTMLTAYSDYGKTQIVSGIKLSDANTASRILIGLLIGGGATLLHRTYKAVSNIGTNYDAEAQTPVLTVAPLGSAAPPGFQESIDNPEGT